MTLHCPPMAVLTLVENAVRHGIDPSEKGGRVEIRVAEVIAAVSRSSIPASACQDSDRRTRYRLSTLRERLHLMFGDAAQLRLVEHRPRGVSAELEFPARRGVRMSEQKPTALIADDEPLLRHSLRRLLGQAWPELEVLSRPATDVRRSNNSRRCNPISAFSMCRCRACPASKRRATSAVVRISSSSPLSTGTPSRPSSMACSIIWSSRSSPNVWPKRSRACRSACDRRKPAIDTEALIEQLAAHAERATPTARCAGFVLRSDQSCG